MDTLDANLALDLVDAREYDFSAHMLKQVGVSSVRLMTNNPLKIDGLVLTVFVSKSCLHHRCMQDQQPLSLTVPSEWGI